MNDSLRDSIKEHFVGELPPIEPGSFKKPRSIKVDEAYWYRAAISCPEKMGLILDFVLTKGAVHDELEKLEEIYLNCGQMPTNHPWMDGISPVVFTDADMMSLDNQIHCQGLVKLKETIDPSKGLSETELLDIYHKMIPTPSTVPGKETIFDSFESHKAIFDELLEEKQGVVPTGLSRLDTALDGGFLQGELYCAVSPAGIGKSLQLSNIAATCATNGLIVGFVSTEMAAKQIHERVAKAMTMESEVVKIHLKMQKTPPKGKIIYKVFEAFELCGSDIDSLFEDQQIDILLIDYADELTTHMKAESEYFKFGYIFRELRNLAKRMNIPVVTVTQGNKTMLAKDGPGTVGSCGAAGVSDSYQKIRPVYACWNLLQSSEQQPLKGGTQGYYTIELFKNRSGEKTAFEVQVDYEFYKMYD